MRACSLVVLVAALTGVEGCAEDYAEPNAFTRPDASSLDDQPDQPKGNPPKPPVDGGSHTTPDSGDDTPKPTGQPPQDAECDLNGRWLVSQRVLAVAIGQEQASHNWFYYEIRHEGAQVVVTKGLHCGYEVQKKTLLAAAVDSSGAWQGFLEHNSDTGRNGSYVKEGENCRLKFDRRYAVRGATVSYYQDQPTAKLPDKTQAASAESPGWEDWDQDGNPGISLVVRSTAASGTLYTCQRDWTVYDGTTPLNPSKFKLPITYGGEQKALGRSPGSSQAIETTSTPSSDATQHFAWLHKLADGQATGSDAEICAAVRQLKDELVPEANE